MLTDYILPSKFFNDLRRIWITNKIHFAGVVWEKEEDKL